MPTITVPDETFDRLSRRADVLKTSIGDVVDRLVRDDRLRNISGATVLSDDNWQQHFDAILRLARSHEQRYPPGFEADISRDTMYGDEAEC